MKIIFTICSNNYLAQAKALGDSVLGHNPDYKFIICLCDKKNSEIDYSFFKPHSIIEVHEIGINKFEQMCYQYNIIELNTSIKPFVFDYLFKTYKDAEYVMYFDPDTYVFDKLTAIEEELKDNSILLTPHIYTPIEFDGKTPTENAFTQHGIYNLGFLATKRDENTFELLNWWMRRLEINCYDRASKGIFVDQLPMNFAPIFFKNVKISDNWGLNMAPWNLHERILIFNGNRYFVNDKNPLIFYHFSNCDPNKSDLLSTYYTRVSFDNNDILKKAYDKYKKEVLNNNYDKLSKIGYFYSKNKLSPQKNMGLLKILKEADFQNKLDELAVEYKNKKVLIYGAGNLFDIVNENYDLSKLNIIGISDKKFKEVQTYKGYKAFPPKNISELNPDIMLIALEHPKMAEDFFKREIFPINGEFNYAQLFEGINFDTEKSFSAFVPV